MFAAPAPRTASANSICGREHPRVSNGTAKGYKTAAEMCWARGVLFPSLLPLFLLLVFTPKVSLALPAWESGQIPADLAGPQVGPRIEATDIPEKSSSEEDPPNSMPSLPAPSHDPTGASRAPDDTHFPMPLHPLPPSSAFPRQPSQEENCDPLKKIFSWKNLVTAAVDELSERMIRYEEFELLDHYCSFFTRPYLIKWRIQILADVWCPGWTTIIGSGLSSKTSESIRLAIQDFVRRAQAEGVIHPDDIKYWFNNNNNNKTSEPQAEGTVSNMDAFQTR